jgi:hypothetical protein
MSVILLCFMPNNAFLIFVCVAISLYFLIDIFIVVTDILHTISLFILLKVQLSSLSLLLLFILNKLNIVNIPYSCCFPLKVSFV